MQMDSFSNEMAISHKEAERSRHVNLVMTLKDIIGHFSTNVAIILLEYVVLKVHSLFLKKFSNIFYFALHSNNFCNLVFL